MLSFTRKIVDSRHFYLNVLCTLYKFIYTFRKKCIWLTFHNNNHNNPVLFMVNKMGQNNYNPRRLEAYYIYIILLFIYILYLYCIILYIL